MTYLQYKDLKPEDFKRLCGVHKETFARMVSVITEQVEQKKRKPGKPSKLSVTDLKTSGFREGLAKFNSRSPLEKERS